MYHFPQKKVATGFSLIEVIVVFAIISILIGVTTVSFLESRQAVRDEVRKSTLKELQLVIEQYRAQYGRYPAAGCGAGSAWVGPGTVTESWGVACENYIVGLVPDFMAALPRDPREDLESSSHVVGIMYRTDADGTSYKILFRDTVEVNQVSSYTDPFARCPRPFPAGPAACQPSDITAGRGVQDYALYSPGAEGW